jgi:predicted small lipoprotein YifL
MVLLCAAGCGQKGPLYLPDPTPQNVPAGSAQPAQAPAAPAAPAAPEKKKQPAGDAAAQVAAPPAAAR